MRIQFQTLARPRRSAKALTDNIPSLKLTEAQEAVARICGYASWNELRIAAMQPGVVPSPDDEELDDTARAARREFQAQAVRHVFGGTLAQATRIVELTSPTIKKLPAPAQKEERRRLRGNTIYMPSLTARFLPMARMVEHLLYDVSKFRINFVQPDYISSWEAHLASNLTFHFYNGTTLQLGGQYFWRFLDAIPHELLDARGAVFEPNPYTQESVEDMMDRLRLVYKFLFVKAEPDSPSEFVDGGPGGGRPYVEPPLYAEFDFEAETFTRKNQLALRKPVCEQFMSLYAAEVEASLPLLQPVVDAFVVTMLRADRFKLEYAFVGGRGQRESGVLRNQLVRYGWQGAGHWTIEDLMKQTSGTNRHESGCGGNLSMGELFTKELESSARQIVENVCLKVCQLPEHAELYQAIRLDLELPAFKSAKPRASTKASQLVQMLMRLRYLENCKHLLSSRLEKAQKGRTLNSWNPALKVDESMKRPTVEFEELLRKGRSALK